MSNNQTERPRELIIAIVLASAAVLLSFATVFAWREEFGAGWGFVLFIRFLALAVYAVILVLAYQGRGGVRYGYAALVLFSLFYQAFQDVSAILHPIVATAYGLSVLSIGFFFAPVTSLWYRQQQPRRK